MVHTDTVQFSDWKSFKQGIAAVIRIEVYGYYINEKEL